MFVGIHRLEHKRLEALVSLSPLKPKKKAPRVDAVARPPMPVRTERWVVMDASASSPGRFFDEDQFFDLVVLIFL